MHFGILYAFGALLGWAFGDFFIQRTTRAVGITKSLFYIGLVGMFGLFPFVYRDIPEILSSPATWPLLFTVCLVVILAAFANFQGLKTGKLSVVMPLTGLELPITIALSLTIGHERFGLPIYFLLALASCGILLLTTPDFRDLGQIGREKGSGYALMGAIGLGLTNFLIGIMSRGFSPLFTIWLTHTAATLACLAILFYRRELRVSLFRSDLIHHAKIIFLQSVLDNLAWLSYAFATALIPISIAATISESFIAIGALLGLAINREKLKAHQLIGLTATLAGVILLSALVD